MNRIIEFFRNIIDYLVTWWRDGKDGLFLRAKAIACKAGVHTWSHVRLGRYGKVAVRYCGYCHAYEERVSYGAHGSWSHWRRKYNRNWITTEDKWLRTEEKQMARLEAKCKNLEENLTVAL